MKSSFHFNAQAYEKAGSIDREKFINALEGMKTDIVTLPGREFLPACEEIRKVRGGS